MQYENLVEEAPHHLVNHHIVANIQLNIIIFKPHLNDGAQLKFDGVSGGEPRTNDRHMHKNK